MSAEATVTLIVLYEHEIRAAAKALAAAVAAAKEDAEDYPERATEALNACLAALHGVHQHPDASLVLTSAEHVIGRQKRRKS